LDLVKKIKKEEKKQIAYFNADLVNSDRLIFQNDQNINISHEINMVTTIIYVSDDKEEDEIEDEQGEGTDCEDPEYGNPYL
jgi:hypothetical protein